MTGKAIIQLLEATGWTRRELADAMIGPNVFLTPAPTAEQIEEWEKREDLSAPIGMCLCHVAATQRLVWERGRWVSGNTDRMTGGDVRRLRERLKWSQSRLARELGTKQSQIAAWEANSAKRLTGLATYALRAVEARYAHQP